MDWEIKRQRKGWSVSALSHCTVFDNLLVIRCSVSGSESARQIKRRLTGYHGQIYVLWSQLWKWGNWMWKWTSTQILLFLCVFVFLFYTEAWNDSLGRVACLWGQHGFMKKTLKMKASRKKKGWRKDLGVIQRSVEGLLSTVTSGSA